MKITNATIHDAQAILDLQKLAYQSEAEIYNDYSIPPLMQTLSEIENEFNQQTFLKMTSNGTIVASVRGYEKNGVCYIGRLIVHPEYQNQGIGANMLAAIERYFSYANRYELFTGDKSERNLYFYTKHGYRQFKQESLNNQVEIVYLEKYQSRLKR
jgi:GNAT superfamily N-acetyltransferase